MADESSVGDVSSSSSPTHLNEENESSQSGRSFVDAAWDKFNCDLPVDDTILIHVPKKGPAKITDSGHLILPWRVHMTDCGITEAGQHADMTRMCSEVTELDLSHNCITSLQEVLHMIRCMPKLTFLNLSDNPLHSSTIPVMIYHTAAIQSATGVTNIIVRSADTTPTDASDASVKTDDNMPPTCTNNPPGPETESQSVSNQMETVHDTNANTEEVKTFPSVLCDKNTLAENSIPNSSSPITQDADCFVSSCLPCKGCQSAFSTLRQLVLNSTFIEWSGIVRLLRLFPSLDELHLSLNNYTTVDLPADFMYPSLSRLFFNNNKINTWSQISHLGYAFPNLQHLLLAETDIASIDEDGDRLAQEFPVLESLSLNKTQLSGWDEIERLRLLPSLIDMRLLGIPFLEAQEEALRRQQLVARLPNIQRLNGSKVTEEERLDAERAFIRLFLDSEDKPDRYYELEKVHGKLDPLAKVNLKPQTIFSVHIVMDDRRELMEVDVNQTVRDLKKSLQNIVGLPCSKFMVFYDDKQVAIGPDKLKYPDKKLYTYNLTDGDEFIIIVKQ